LPHNTSKPDFLIIGGGLAGITLADALSSGGAAVTVIDKNGIATGASGAPVGMADPAASRNANLFWEPVNCYSTIKRILEEVRDYTHKTFYRETPVCRPALSHERARAYQRSLERQDWPEGWCTWLSESEIHGKYQGINCVEGGLWHTTGLTVAIPDFLEAYLSMLRDRGIQYKTIPDYSLLRIGSAWNFKSDALTLSTKNVIHATGSASLKSTYWSDLPNEPVKGQLLQMKPEGDIPFDFALSGNGYISWVHPDQLIVGSTYEHEFTHPEPDENGRKTIMRKFRQILPEIAIRVTLQHHWSAIRVSTPNRLPVIGAHHSEPGLHLFTGLGSKGLLYSRYTAQHLANNLLNGKQIRRELDIQRIYKKMDFSSTFPGNKP